MKKILFSLIVILSQSMIYPQYFLNFPNAVNSWVKRPGWKSDACNISIGIGCLYLAHQAHTHAQWYWQKEIGIEKYAKFKAAFYWSLTLGIGVAGCYAGFYGIKNAGNSLYAMLRK